MVELMVAIGIMVILAGILLVGVNKATASARRTRAKADLQMISVGLEAYRQDFGDYPRALGNLADYSDGAWLLCRALVAPGPETSARPMTADGANDVGFRVRSGGQGRIYGPYVNVEKFTVQTVDTGVATDPIRYYLVDKVFSSDQHPPILYVPKHVRTILPAQGYVDVNSNVMYDFTYAANMATVGVWPTLGTKTPVQQVRMMMGIKPANIANNFISAGETPAFTGPYILWMAGSDGLFGLTNAKGGRDVDDQTYTTDDVANFDFDSSITPK